MLQLLQGEVICAMDVYDSPRTSSVDVEVIVNFLFCYAIRFHLRSSMDDFLLGAVMTNDADKLADRFSAEHVPKNLWRLPVDIHLGNHGFYDVNRDSLKL